MLTSINDFRRDPSCFPVRVDDGALTLLYDNMIVKSDVARQDIMKKTVDYKFDLFWAARIKEHRGFQLTPTRAEISCIFIGRCISRNQF